MSRLLVVPTPSRRGREVRVYYGAPESRLALPRILDYVKASLGLAVLLAEPRAYWLDCSKLYVVRSVAFAVDFPSRFSHGPAKPAPVSRILAGAAGRRPEYAILGITEEGEPIVGLPGLGYASLPLLSEREAGDIRVVEHFSVSLPLATQPKAAKPLKGAVSVSQDGVLEVAGFEGEDLALYMSGRIGYWPGSSYTGDLHDFESETVASWRAFRAVLMGFDPSHAYVAGEPVLQASGGFEGLVERAREGASDACSHGKTLAEGRGPIRGISAPIEGILRIELADGSAVQLANVEAAEHVG